MATYPLTIWTIRSQVENGYTVFQHCHRCQKNLGEVDLQELMRRGLGERSVRSAGLRCQKCRAPLGFTVDPPSRHSGASLRVPGAPSP